MREQRFPSRGLAALGLLSFGFAILAAGCGKGGGSSASVTPNLTSPTPGAVCASGGGGVAYIPASSTAATNGIIIQPFETSTGQFIASCNQSFLSTQGAVSELSLTSGVITPALGDGAAIIKNGTQVVGLSGFLEGSAPYVTAFSSQTQSSNPLTSIVILPAGSLGIAVDSESPLPGPTAGFIGVNNFLNIAPTPLPTLSPGATPTATPSISPSATPTAYNPPIVNPAQVPYTSIGANPTSSPYAPSTGLGIPSGSVVGRPTIALGPDGQTMLVRGDKDLIAFAIETSAAGFYVLYPADESDVPVTDSMLGQNTTLGYPTGLTSANYGRGLVAFDPTTAARAIIGGTSASGNVVSEINQIPNNLSVVNTVTVGTTPITSLAISPAGNIGAVGTSGGGLVMISGISGNAMSAVTQTAFTGTITYLESAGGATTAKLTNIISVAFSPDAGYVLVVANNGDNTASLLAFRVDAFGNLTSPVGSTMPVTLGSSFPVPNGDSLVVR